MGQTDYNPVIDPDHFVNASAFRDPTTAWYGPDGTGERWSEARGEHGGGCIIQEQGFLSNGSGLNTLHSAKDTGMGNVPTSSPCRLNRRRGLRPPLAGTG
ncbi:hypothetical protein HPP92_024506 [Vanilla planifolia]|uniref:Uncharacterized protein n=1 Tax=Vanilla planifolia TaxID=51239 RepID=A0A835U9Z6_VANPL|nr:hypothetical protein HPP92_024506 [Vanilla planifolia]